MEIRLALEADAKDVKDCVDAAFSAWIPIIGSKPVAMQTNYAALIKMKKVYVGLNEGNIVAVLAMWIHGDALYLDTVAVNPELQKQGLGKNLLDFAEREARGQKQNKVSLCTNSKMFSNRRYYQKLGYQEVRTTSMEDGRAIIWMEKRL
jgi:N-acetylglutamate synthase-like GNAT family acetyltransferase